MMTSRTKTGAAWATLLTLMVLSVPVLAGTERPPERRCQPERTPICPR
nr:hypothetical protein [Polymorphobacter sp.]